MSLSFIMSVAVTLIGLVYTIAALLLPMARIGIPTAPRVFPLILGIGMLLFGAVLVIEESRKVLKATEGQKGVKMILTFGASEKNIVWTILNGILYALLFDRLGYVFSTIIFLELELIIFRGVAHWARSLIVAVLFSVIAFLIFYTGLGVYLPTSVLQFI